MIVGARSMPTSGMAVAVTPVEARSHDQRTATRLRADVAHLLLLCSLSDNGFNLSQILLLRDATHMQQRKFLQRGANRHAPSMYSS